MTDTERHAAETRAAELMRTRPNAAEIDALLDALSVDDVKRGRARAVWWGLAGFAVFLVACSPVDVYPCDRDVLELPADAPPMQVVQCIEGTCDPIQWWTTGDVLVVPCDGGEVWVWW